MEILSRQFHLRYLAHPDLRCDPLFQTGDLGPYARPIFTSQILYSIIKPQVHIVKPLMNCGKPLSHPHVHILESAVNLSKAVHITKAFSTALSRSEYGLSIACQQTAQHQYCHYPQQGLNAENKILTSMPGMAGVPVPKRSSESSVWLVMFTVKSICKLQKQSPLRETRVKRASPLI